MVKKLFVASLWFVSASMAYSLVAYVLGLPSSGGVVVGVLVAAFVLLDPAGVLWNRQTRASASETLTAAPQPN
jgi:hypothetical protein